MIEGAEGLSGVRLLALSGVALTALSAGVAGAQTATTSAMPGQSQVPQPGQPAETDPAVGPSSDDGDIVVTGFRQSIENSIAIKRQSTSVVEAVSAEDIGKLPDVSIAESLARLPGVAGQRVNGRVQVISIRGLPEQFATTLLNGRQQVSSGDNRAAEFDQYPSELVNGAVIYKTSNAALVGQGLAGTVDLRSIRPLTLDKPTVALNGRYEVNSFDRLNADGSRTGFRVSGSYVDQFLDDTLGIAIGYAHLDSPTQVKHQQSWYWDGMGGALGPDVLSLGGQGLRGTNRDQIRDGFLGVIQYEPSDAFQTTVDLFYSEFKQTERTRGMEWWSALGVTGGNGQPDGLAYINPQITTIGAQRVNLSGTYANVTPIVINIFNKRKDKLFAAGWNTSYTADRTKLIVDLGYSRLKRDEVYTETYSGYGLTRLPNPAGVTSPTGTYTARTYDNIGYDISPDGFSTYSPGLDYADAGQMRLGDPAAWGGWGHDGAIRFPEVDDRMYTADFRVDQKLDGTFAEDVLEGVELGVNYTDRRKTREIEDNDLFLKNGRQPVAVDQQYLVDPTSLGFTGIGGVLSYNVPAVVNAYYDVVPIQNADDFNADWSIREKIFSAFVMAKIDATLGGIGLRGNIGVQYVRTKQASTGFTFAGNGVAPEQRTQSDTYDEFLPSLNLIFDPGGEWLVRVGAAKTVARPRLDDLRGSLSAGVSQNPDGSTTWSGNGGNPTLRPWKADAYDLTVEKYFGGSSYLAVNGFYKKLNSYIYTQTVPYDFTNVPNTGTLPTPTDPIGLLSRPVNGDGGTIKGIEASGAFDFGLLWKPLTGFGVIGSHAWTWTSIEPDGPGQPTTLPGFSKRVRNITVYYERDGFSARISQRYRSAFRGEVIQLFGRRAYDQINADDQVDAQIGYTFQEGSRLAGLGVLVQVNNLTNSPYQTGNAVVSDGQRAFLPRDYDEYGRQVLVGLNYRF